MTDFATLAAMAQGSDRIHQQMTARDRRYLAPMLVALANSRQLWTPIEGAERGILALAALTAPPRLRVAPSATPSMGPEPPGSGL